MCPASLSGPAKCILTCMICISLMTFINCLVRMTFQKVELCESRIAFMKKVYILQCSAWILTSEQMLQVWGVGGLYFNHSNTFLYLNQDYILTLDFLCTLEVVKQFVWWWWWWCVSPFQCSPLVQTRPLALDLDWDQAEQ